MPKIAIVSDIHGNLSALKSVIEILNTKKPDTWICLGDILGYGPYPVECLEIVMDMNMKTVLGNHDAAVAGIESLKLFRNPNRRLLEISRKLLSPTHINWIKSLPYILRGDSWIAAHASPIVPEKWMYLESAIKIRSMLGEIEEMFCFTGHTHIPSFVPEKLGLKKINSGVKYFLNPGSVGQPRDHDYRASCAILDTDNLEYEILRVNFDIENTLMALRDLGFTKEETKQLMRIDYN